MLYCHRFIVLFIVLIKSVINIVYITPLHTGEQ